MPLDQVPYRVEKVVRDVEESMRNRGEVEVCQAFGLLDFSTEKEETGREESCNHHIVIHDPLESLLRHQIKPLCCCRSDERKVACLYLVLRLL